MDTDPPIRDGDTRLALLARVGLAFTSSADLCASIQDRILVENHDRHLEVTIEASPGPESRSSPYYDGSHDDALALERRTLDTSLDTRLAPELERPRAAQAPSDMAIDPSRSHDGDLALERAPAWN